MIANKNIKNKKYKRNLLEKQKRKRDDEFELSDNEEEENDVNSTNNFQSDIFSDMNNELNDELNENFKNIKNNNTFNPLLSSYNPNLPSLFSSVDFENYNEKSKNFNCDNYLIKINTPSKNNSNNYKNNKINNLKDNMNCKTISSHFVKKKNKDISHQLKLNFNKNSSFLSSFNNSTSFNNSVNFNSFSSDSDFNFVPLSPSSSSSP
jgi:hypothetical protein